MSSDFSQLVEIADIIDSSHQTPTYVEHGVPMVRVTDVKYGALNLSSARHVSVETFRDYSRRYKAKPKDIIISRVGSYGNTAWVVETEFCLGQNVASISPKTIDARYLFFALNSGLIWSQIESKVVGSTQKTLSLKAIKELRVPRFGKTIESEIGGLLGALDDRITLLRETNATLEAIAQALFKSWFIDFDPVRAKHEGRAPEGMDEATAALFPDGFEESELGLVPMGWRVGGVYEVAQVTYGAPFASSRFNSDKVGRPLIRIRDLKDESPGVFTEEVHPKGRLVLPGEIVVGMDGEFRAYLWGGEPAWLNQRLCLFSPVGDAPTAFVRLSIIPLLAAVEATETATTVIHLGKNDIDRFKVRIPPSPILKAFGEVVNPIYEKIVASKLQASTLATLRDTLLPRLISGKLRLPEAEAMLDSVH